MHRARGDPLPLAPCRIHDRQGLFRLRFVQIELTRVETQLFGNRNGVRLSGQAHYRVQKLVVHATHNLTEGTRRHDQSYQGPRLRQSCFLVSSQRFGGEQAGEGRHHFGFARRLARILVRVLRESGLRHGQPPRGRGDQQ